MKFEDWYSDNWPRLTGGRFKDGVKASWQAAQKAERDRANELVEALKEIAEAYGTEDGIGEIAHAAIAKYEGASNEP
jgi:hypothetical protein